MKWNPGYATGGAYVKIYIKANIPANTFTQPMNASIYEGNKSYVDNQIGNNGKNYADRLDSTIAYAF